MSRGVATLNGSVHPLVETSCVQWGPLLVEGRHMCEIAEPDGSLAWERRAPSFSSAGDRWEYCSRNPHDAAGLV